MGIARRPVEDRIAPSFLVLLARFSPAPLCSAVLLIRRWRRVATQWSVSLLFHNILGRIPPAFLHLHVCQPFILRACHQPSRTGPGWRYHQETLYY